MNVIDRFTRDEVSANVWWPFAVVLLALCILTIPGQNRAEDRARADAARRASASAAALAPSLERVGFQPPVSGNTDQLVAEANDQILQEEPAASQVRAWTLDGRLIFSSDPADQVGSGGALNDEQLTAVVNTGSQVDIVTSSDLLGEEQPETFVTYSPVAEASGALAAVVQVDHPQSVLLDHVNTAWLGYRLVTGILGLLVLLLAVLSLREPAARLGAGVRITPEMVPGGQSLIDTDELVTLKESGTAAKRRVASMEDRVRVAEEERWKLEGQVQHLLSASGVAAAPTKADLATPAARPTSSGRPSPPRQPIVVEAVGPEVTIVPEAQTESAPAGPAAEVAPEAQTKPKAKAARKSEPDAEPEPAVRAEPEPQPEPVQEPEPEPETVMDVPESDEIVRVPDPQPVAARAPSGEESPVDILERFLGAGTAPEPLEDPSIMRAKLARTADLKKPGSRERREREREGREEPPA